MQDPAVTLAVIALVSTAVVGALGLSTSLVGMWNTQRLFKNQQLVIQQQRAWDVADRKELHDKTLKAVEAGTVVATEAKTVAKEAYTEANHVNKKIERVNENIETLEKNITAVLKVAESVKHDTGQHKPLGKDDVAAVAQGVVQAIRATGPLAPTTGD